MRLIAVGVNYSSAPLAVRERLSVAAPHALAALGERGAEGFILSTCSRTEMYALAPQPTDPLELFASVFGASAHLSSSELRDVAYVHVRDAAVRHLLRVTCGLDSIVLGEDQIHAQVKKCLDSARGAGALGAVTDRLGAAALACSKRVRATTGIGRHAVSLESLAVRTARQRVGPFGAKQILIIGAGDSASIVLKLLRASDASDVTIVSRTKERAHELADRHGARARAATGNAELAESLVEADVVFCCTSAPHPVVTPDLLRSRRDRRGSVPLLCVDLGMPRDVHPDVAMLGVDVVGLDALEALAETHRASRRADVPAAEAIVEHETTRFLEWQRSRTVAVAVTATSAHADAVVREELSRVLTCLEGATLRDKALIAEMAQRIARKLAHSSIVALKAATDDSDHTYGENTLS